MKKININKLIRPHIINMKPYSSARAEYTGDDGIFLDANENPIGSVCEELHNRYPDPLQHKVKEKLSEQESLNINQIFLGNGSDECIDVLIRTFCEPKEDKIIVCPPVFSMYEHSAHSQNVEVIEVLLKEETFELDINVIANVVKQSVEMIETDCIVPQNDKTVKIIFICSPNNPTGNLMNKKDIETILNNFDGLVLIDEAYQDFSQNESWTKRLNEFQNLVVIKTFSKAFGMADARLGMLYANEDIIHYLNTIKLPYNISEYTQKLALIALNNIEQKDKFVNELIDGRKYLENELSQILFVKSIYKSDANYILFKVEDANDLYQYLIQHKIIVRNRNSASLLKGCLRVSVGTQLENERFIEIIKNYKK